MAVPHDAWSCRKRQSSQAMFSRLGWRLRKPGIEFSTLWPV